MDFDSLYMYTKSRLPVLWQWEKFLLLIILGYDGKDRVFQFNDRHQSPASSSSCYVEDTILLIYWCRQKWSILLPHNCFMIIPINSLNILLNFHYFAYPNYWTRRHIKRPFPKWMWISVLYTDFNYGIRTIKNGWNLYMFYQRQIQKIRPSELLRKAAELCGNISENLQNEQARSPR
jgi:hypothetical protein